MQISVDYSLCEGHGQCSRDRHKAGQGLWPWPAAISVELPGIEPALKNALSSGNAGRNDSRARQTTCKHLPERGSC
jgi:hypothetical protein